MACTLVLLAVFFVVILAVVVVIVGILLLLLYFLERKSVRETDEGFGSVARSSGFFFCRCRRVASFPLCECVLLCSVYTFTI